MAQTGKLWLLIAAAGIGCLAAGCAQDQAKTGQTDPRPRPYYQTGSNIPVPNPTYASDRDATAAEQTIDTLNRQQSAVLPTGTH
jgi:hypothetical protein